MSVRINPLKRQEMRRDIKRLMRSFPTSGLVTILRAGYVETDLGEQTKIFSIIWSGDALIRRVSGTVQRIEQGQILTGTLGILVAGQHDFRQGDFFKMEEAPRWAANHPQPVVDTLFQIQRVVRPFRAFIVMEANLYQQQVP